MDTLPIELLSLIAVQLRPIDWDGEIRAVHRHALLDLSAARRECHKAARPELFHSLDFEDRRITGLRLLLEALIAEPALCDLVKILRTTPWKTDSDDRPRAPSRPWDAAPGACPGTSSCTLSSIMQSLGLQGEYAQKLHSAFHKRSTDADGALLLSMCSKLEVLYYCPSESFEKTLIHGALCFSSMEPSGTALSAFGSCSENSLQCLREIILQPARWNTGVKAGWISFESIGLAGGYAIRQLIPILQLSKLSTLKVASLCLHPPHTHYLPRMPNLRYLSVTSACFDSTGVSRLLDQCPALHTLLLYWGHPNWCDGIPTWDEISAVIARKSNDIRCLELLHVDGTMTGECISNMQDARSLRDFTVTSRILFGLQYEHQTIYNEESRLTLILPYSLQILEIVQADENDATWHDQVLWTLMTDARFKTLDTVIIHRSRAFSVDVKSSSWELDASDSTRIVLQRET